MDAEMENPPVPNDISVVPSAMIGEPLPVPSPEPVARKEESVEVNLNRPNPAERTDIVGVEEVAIPHVGALIAFVAAILILINFLPLVLH